MFCHFLGLHVHVLDNLLFCYVLWKAKTDKGFKWNCCLFCPIGQLQLFTVATVVCYGVDCDSTRSGGQSYRRLTPWPIPNGPDSRNQSPEGRIIKNSSWWSLSWLWSGLRFNLPIVSFYNPVSEFTFIGPLFSATPAGWRLSSVCPAINQVPLLENRAVCTDRPRFDEPPKQTYSSLAQNPLQNFALLFKCITISDGLTAC